jgi:hypothetical protein
VEELRSDLVKPFANVERQEVPNLLWFNIKEKIKEEAEARPQEATLIDKIIGSFHFPKLAPVLSGLLIILLASSTIYNKQIKQAKDKDQVEYLASVLTTETETENNTPIEQYFL